MHTTAHKTQTFDCLDPCWQAAELDDEVSGKEKMHFAADFAWKFN